MEKRLIKNGKVNFDKVHTENELKEMAFTKLELLEELMEDYEIESMLELTMLLRQYWVTLKIKDVANKTTKLRNANKEEETHEQLKED